MDVRSDQGHGRPEAASAAMSRLMSLFILAVGCLNEFAWQAFPVEMQGDVRAATEGLLMLSLCLAFYAVSTDRFVAAVAIAVGIMSLSTAMCSLAWLIHPFETLAGEDQCSKQVGIPLLLVSALGACMALSQWRPRRE